MKTTKTIITAIMLCFFAFANAQEKKLPNKEETEIYITKMLNQAKGKVYIVNDNKELYVSLKVERDNYFEKYSSIEYDTGKEEIISCNRYGKDMQTNTYVYENYSDYDFGKLIEVKQVSKNVLNATALQVILIFNSDHIEKDNKYYRAVFGGCETSRGLGRVNKMTIYIRNEEGSFDRFKKALFHYKDLLIAEQKQKIADDPFAN